MFYGKTPYLFAVRRLSNAGLMKQAKQLGNAGATIAGNQWIVDQPGADVDKCSTVEHPALLPSSAGMRMRTLGFITSGI